MRVLALIILLACQSCAGLELPTAKQLAAVLAQGNYTVTRGDEYKCLTVDIDGRTIAVGPQPDQCRSAIWIKQTAESIVQH